MSEILICITILLTLPLAIWIGNLYFDGDFGDCFGAALTPWPFSLLMGGLSEHLVKALKFEVFMIGVALSGYLIFTITSAASHWVIETVIPFFG